MSALLIYKPGTVADGHERTIEAAGKAKKVKMNGDWHWFCARPARSYRARLATRAEIDDLIARAAIDPALLTGARFVYVIVRYDRGVNSLQKIFAALEPLRDFSEDECRQEWFEADQLVDARIEKLAQ